MGDTKVSVFQIVTDKILERLDAGEVPWRKPWTGLDIPRNLHSKKEYRGINIWLLSTAPYQSPWWLSFKQVNQHGGQVKAGEKGCIVTYWKLGKYTKRQIDGTEKEQTSLLFRYYRVWNTEQCTGLAVPTITVREHKPIEEAEALVRDYPAPPTIAVIPPRMKGQSGVIGEGRACYYPSLDKVQMPCPESFESGEHYYATLFHELVHSTGHESRLKRLNKQGKQDWHDAYSKEELVAEMGATFLGYMCGINNKSVVQNAAAYIQHWRNAIAKDNKLVVFASGKAQKAVDWIRGKKAGEINNE